ncbi:hypothetical protein, partial [Rothia kristinae]|uniref:hypothetical protein n=1 Tax=Rothia kristinae TaxID=37923 RepID=UPI000AAEE384
MLPVLLVAVDNTVLSFALPAISEALRPVVALHTRPGLGPGTTPPVPVPLSARGAVVVPVPGGGCEDQLRAAHAVQQ